MIAKEGYWYALEDLVLAVTAAAALAKWSFRRQWWRARTPRVIGSLVCSVFLSGARRSLVPAVSLPLFCILSGNSVSCSLSSTSFCVRGSVSAHLCCGPLRLLAQCRPCNHLLLLYNLIKDKVVCVGPEHGIPMEDERLKIKANIL